MFSSFAMETVLAHYIVAGVSMDLTTSRYSSLYFESIGRILLLHSSTISRPIKKKFTICSMNNLFMGGGNKETRHGEYFSHNPSGGLPFSKPLDEHISSISLSVQRLSLPFPPI
jgi:hypothetical protein